MSNETEGQRARGKLVVEGFASVADAQADGLFDWAGEDNDWGPVGVVWLQSESGGTTGLPGSVETTLPYARLFAAAPDLLEALDWFLDAVRGHGWDDCDPMSPEYIAYDLAMQAIARATGGGQ